ncbi:MAG: hypothetical protein K2O16_13215 [Lachnospiraceae bacterium]|nr:hypothetical protein [Lachnospiraceae bacterium]
MKKWMETVKSLLYSINIVFKADKLRFLLSVIIQIVNTLLGYLLLYIGKCTIDSSDEEVFQEICAKGNERIFQWIN